MLRSRERDVVGHTHVVQLGAIRSLVVLEFPVYECLEKLNGSLWHAYRRRWATARKHLPDADVAAAGGWANPNTLRLVYQQADADTMLRVVLEPDELREAK